MTRPNHSLSAEQIAKNRAYNRAYYQARAKVDPVFVEKHRACARKTKEQQRRAASNPYGHIVQGQYRPEFLDPAPRIRARAARRGGLRKSPIIGAYATLLWGIEP